MFMNIHVAVGIVAALMLLDYFLTFKGYQSYKKHYAKYVEIEAYELNPTFKKSIKEGKYSAKHGASVIFVALILYALYYYIQIVSSPIFNIAMLIMAQGMLVSAFLYVNVRHIRNLLIFSSIKRDDKMLEGKLRQSNTFSLKASCIDALGMFLMLFFVFLFFPNVFTLGFASGPLIILLVHLRWMFL